MSTCIGWDADTTCPAWNMPTHGCKYKPGHRGTPHRCECGAEHLEDNRHRPEAA